MNPDVDSDQESQEAEDLASQELSQTSDDSKSHSLTGAELAQAAKDDPVASEELRRHFQSKKDIGVADANKTAQEALSMVEQLAGYLDMKPDQIKQAQRDMVLDGLIASQTDSKPVVSEQPVTEAKQPESSVDYIEAYEKVGMKTPDSPEEFAWAAQFKSTVALKNALVEKKANLPAEKEASPGTAVSPSGGKSPTKIDEVALNAEFNSLTGKPMDMLLDSGETVRARRAEIAKLVG